MRVLFVCTGNTCRSPMCEAYFNHLAGKAQRLDVSAESAGIAASAGERASEQAAAVMKRYSIDLSEHRSQLLTVEKIAGADMIIALSASHRQRIGRLCPEALGKTRLLLEYVFRKDADVRDPFGGDEEVYAGCFEEMKPAVENLFLDIIKK